MTNNKPLIELVEDESVGCADYIPALWDAVCRIKAIASLSW